MKRSDLVKGLKKATGLSGRPFPGEKSLTWLRNMGTRERERLMGRDKGRARAEGRNERSVGCVRQHEEEILRMPGGPDYGGALKTSNLSFILQEGEGSGAILMTYAKQLAHWIQSVWDEERGR